MAAPRSSEWTDPPVCGQGTSPTATLLPYPLLLAAAAAGSCSYSSSSHPHAWPGEDAASHPSWLRHKARRDRSPGMERGRMSPDLGQIQTSGTEASRPLSGPNTLLCPLGQTPRPAEGRTGASWGGEPGTSVSPGSCGQSQVSQGGPLCPTGWGNLRHTWLREQWG